jgi:hypothetical protein
MATFTEWIAAGYAYGFIYFIDSNGFATGGSPTAPAQGAAGSAALRIRAVKSAAPTIPDPETTQVTGDDDLEGEFQYPSIASRRFNIEYSVESHTRNATLLNVTSQVWGEITATPMDIPNPPDYNVGVILQSKAQKKNTGVEGQTGWSGVLVPLATATPLGRAGFDERGAAVFRMSIAPQKAGYDPFGITINDTTYSTTAARYLPFTSEYPIVLQAWRGTGAILQFTLDYQPISAVKTPVYVNRVLATTSSVITTSPYSVDLSANPAGAAAIVALHEFQT